MGARAAGRRFRYVALGALVLVGALAALALFARSETALRWAAQRTAAWSDGQVVLRDVTGSILGPLRAGEVIYRDEGTEVSIQALELDWRPLGLLAGQIRVAQLAAASAVVINKQASPEPVRLPDDLGLPYPVTVGSVTLPRLVIRGEGYETVLEDIGGRIEARPGQYRVRLDSLGYGQDRLAGELTLGAQEPFAADGSLTLSTTFDERPLRLPLGLSGTLERLRVDATLDEVWGKGKGFLVLAPFGDQVVQELGADLREVNPTRARAEAPDADLALLLSVRETDGVLSGSARLQNRRPGTVDRNLLPVETLESRLVLTEKGVRLEDLLVSLGTGGSFSGEGDIGPDSLRLRLETRGTDLRAIHGALKPLRLAGAIAVTATAAQQDFSARLESGIYRLHMDALLKEKNLTVRDASLKARGSELTFTGDMGIDSPRRFSVSGVLRNFDPSQWGDFPGARLNARLQAEGTLSPDIQATLQYQFGRSHWRNETVEGEGTLSYGGKAGVAGEGFVALGGNRVGFRGSLGTPDARLDWTLDARRLAALGSGYGGSLAGQGSVAGALPNPSLDFDVSGNGIRAPGLTLGRVSARGTLGIRPGDELRIAIEARQLVAEQVEMDEVRAEVSGTRKRHALTVAASGPGIEFSAAAEGGLSEKFLWSGTLQRLDAPRPQPLRLLAPVKVTLGADTVDLGATEIAWGSGKLVLDALTWQPGALRTRGHATALPLAQALPRPARANWESSLVLGGQWDLSVQEHIAGRLRLWRESGDLTLVGPKPVPLGLTRLEVQVDAQGSAIAATAAAEGSGLGTVNGRFETPMEKVDGRWRPARDAPLSGELQATMPSIAWLGPLVDPTLRLAGIVDVKASASGTLANPRLKGAMSGSEIEVHVDTAGLHLTDGTLAADFTDDRLDLRQLALRGGEGSVKTKGSMNFAGENRRGELDFKLERLSLVKMPTQLLEVSGEGKVLLEGPDAALTGSIRADRGLIEVREWERPRLSEDVVIVGRETPAPAAGSSRLRLALDLDLGDDFRVTGAGLEARLQGAIQVRSEGGVMKAKGVVRVAEGYYTAYGQQLKIERGALLFDGPLSNPALDILAMRKNQAVEAGVAITGTALSPRTKLVSNPSVPDQEKLSWLVLGQGTGARDESVFSLPGSQAQQPDDYVSIGTQLTSSLYVGVGRSLAGTGTILKLTYVLSDRWSVQTRSGSATGATVIYTISFD